MSAEDEARAAAYRAQADRRAAFRATLEARLTAPESNALRVRDAWEPVQERTRHGEREADEEQPVGIVNG